MSDLAPFVAASIRDKTTVALQDELAKEKNKTKKLEEALDQRDERTVRITGPGGAPVYANAHYVERVNNDDENSSPYQVNLHLHNSSGHNADTSLPMCPVEDIKKCELRIGGKETWVLGKCDFACLLSLNGDTNIQYCLDFGPSVKINDAEWYYSTSLYLEWGPNPHPDSGYVMEPDAYRDKGISYVRFTLLLLVRDPFEDRDTMADETIASAEGEAAVTQLRMDETSCDMKIPEAVSHRFSSE